MANAEKAARAALTTLVLMLLASCSGGGSSGSAGGTVTTPTPAPAPAPAPAPTPTPASAPTLLTLTQDTQFVGYTASNGYFRSGAAGNVTYSQDLGVATGLPAAYSASTGGTTIFFPASLIPQSAIPGPISLTLDSAASDASYSVFRQQQNGVTYLLRRLNVGPSNPTLPLVYSNLALIQASYTDAADGLIKVGVSPLVYGLQYDPALVRLTSAFTYNGILIGHARGTGSSHVYQVTGTVQYRIDFSTNGFTADMHLTGADDVTGATVDLGTFTFTPDRPRTVADFFLASTRDTHAQAFLTGPNGEELVGGFDAQVSDPLTPGVTLKVTGAFAAKR